MLIHVINASLSVDAYSITVCNFPCEDQPCCIARECGPDKIDRPSIVFVWIAVLRRTTHVYATSQPIRLFHLST